MYSTLIISFALAALAAPLPQAGTENSACAANNEYTKIICDDSTHWSQCNWGMAVPMGLTASGTVCQGGAIVRVDTGATVISAGTPPTETSVTSDTLSVDTALSTMTVPATVKTTSNVFITVTRASTPNVEPTTTPVEASSNVLTIPSTSAAAVVAPVNTATAAPSASSPSTGSSSDIKAEQIQAIAPSSSTCSGAVNSDECATASDAAPFVNDAFSIYQITTAGEKAALLSLMAFESGEFKFNINHFPGRPGQGTRNMMMFPFILQYAQSIPNVASAIPAGTTADSSDDVKNQVRALVLDGAHTFATAAWFYSTQCSADVKTGVQSGSLAGWTSYITECIGTTVTSDRQTYWTNAMAALK